MNTDTFFQRYFSVAMKIHAICADLHVCAENSKLYTYIHVKALESNEGSEYFRSPRPADVEALLTMLKGLSGTPEHAVRANKAEARMGFSVSRKIKTIDRGARNAFGMELPLAAELGRRLRLYTDEAFRNRRLAFYNKEILPRIGRYDTARIQLAFVSERRRRKSQADELARMLK